MTNNYHIVVKWLPGPGQSEERAIRQLMPGQFGIELVPTNMPIQVMVVEKVQK